MLDEIHLYDSDNILFYVFFNAHRHTQLTPFEISCPGNHQHVVSDSIRVSLYVGLINLIVTNRHNVFFEIIILFLMNMDTHADNSF